MVRILVFLVILLPVALGLSTVADMPGSLTLTVAGQAYEVSLLVALVAVRHARACPDVRVEPSQLHPSPSWLDQSVQPGAPALQGHDRGLARHDRGRLGGCAHGPSAGQRGGAVAWPRTADAAFESAGRAAFRRTQRCRSRLHQHAGDARNTGARPARPFCRSTAAQ